MQARQNALIPVIVVTGASSRLGAACALLLDHLEFRVFAGVDNLEDGQVLQRKASNRLVPLVLDITSTTSIEAAVETLTNSCNEIGLAGLVNSTTVIGLGPLESFNMDELQRQFMVNVVGLATVTRAFLPLLRQNKGRIVNLSSLAGRLALPWLGPYTASKFAIEALSDVLRIELRPWHIEVSLVEPEVQTDIISVPKASHQYTGEIKQTYGPILSFIDRMIARTEKIGHPADNTAKAVAHALTAKRPQTRYVVSQPFQRFSLHLFRLLPDRVRDRMLARTFPPYP